MQLVSTQERTPNPFYDGVFDMHTVETPEPTGKYGRKGDDTFCDKNCGYYYGFRAAHGQKRKKVKP
jgi:hypothetical protein